MYISQSNGHLSIDKQDLVLYEAIVAFLTELWLGNRLEETYDLATTQFVFLLPKENSETDFVDGFIRPLLLKTPWLSASEPKSRLIFINDMQAYVYSLQDPHHENNISLQREGNI
ncbi:hypothetical protein MAM1_0269c08994 [Mucor ambiguus]|uniref:Uncharacterized protein n=1 Tax=Mucor ambiguus TaxID=91626 RepID=A0A0C9LX11_9FUNG|nr:hypothetical protein MAM1_0269c08994 [Mucor ambiguus]